MDIANVWLPAIGGILLGGVAAGAWYSDHKITGLWFGFAGVMCLLLLVTLQIQQVLESETHPIPVINSVAPETPISKPLLIARISGPYIDERFYSLSRIKEGERSRWIEIKVLVEIENITDTPATIIKSSLAAQGVMGPIGNNAVFVVLTEGEKYYPLRYQQIIPDELKDNPRFKYVSVAGFMLTNELRQQIVRTPPPVVGKLQYLDPSGKRREMGYAFRPQTVWHAGDFPRWGALEYNYDREIEQ